jgi:predicted GNAT family N-acyltransferase
MLTAPTLLAVPLASDLGNLAMALRRQVFVLEQKVPVDEEFDAHDFTATHVVALSNGDLAGCLRMLFLPEHAKIGRVGVAPLFRGQGIATAMMRYAMDLAGTHGETRFYLAAQADKLALYEKLGFTAFGDLFSDGGMPHYAMKTY